MSRSIILVLTIAGLLAPAAAQAAEPPILVPVRLAHALEGRTAKVKVMLSRPAPNAVTVAYATQGLTARAGLDFVPKTGVLTIPQGARQGTVGIRTKHDHLDEPTQTFKVLFSNPTGAKLANRQATLVHILDSNPEVATVAARTVAEPPHAGAKTPIGAVVTLHGATAGTRPVTVGYEIVGVEFTADSKDADLGSGRLHFKKGQTTKVIPGFVKGDTLDEDEEHLAIILTGDRGVYARPGGIIRITDDPGDSEPSISIGDLAVPEGIGGAAQVPLTLTAPSERPVTVTYTTTAGTADTNDFVMTVGTVTFEPDSTTAFAPVALADDLTDEPDQTFTVTLSNPVDVALDDSEATVTIVDDDAPPAISLADATINENAPNASLNVTLSRASEKTVTITPAIVAGGTATTGASCGGGVDILDLSPGLTITIVPGSTLASLTVQGCDDGLEEPSETLHLALQSPVNATLGDAAATLTINDNESGP